MTEAQRAQKAQEPEPSAGREPPQEAPGRPSRQFEVGGRTWTLVDLDDGLSWSLYGESPRHAELGARLAQITISERGYFSTDRAGTVRGPYTTLDEAAYPLALDDQILLDDPDTRTNVQPPLPG